MNRRAEFDAGPLSWVKGEIDLALQRAEAALQAFAAGDAAQIGAARASLHQAHGALEIVGLAGLTRVSGELEALLADLEAGALPAAGSAPAIAVAHRGFAELAAYLNGLMAGQPHQPLRLLPLYEALYEARPATRPAGATGKPDPVDLFHPRLDCQPPRRERAPVQLHPEEAPRYLREQRSRYQRGFLAWMKGTPAEGTSTGAAEMGAAVQAIEQLQSGPARTFWWVAAAALAALEDGGLDALALAERRLLCTRIEGQLRRLQEGAAAVTEQLLREVLYTVARATSGAEAVRQVQEGFALAGQLPGADEPGPEPAFAALLRQALERLAAAKEAWGRYAADPPLHPGELAAYVQRAGELQGLLSAADGQIGPDLEALVAQLAGVGRDIQADAGRMSEVVALEAATALLLVENTLHNLAGSGTVPDPAFPEQSRFVCARLQAALSGRLLRTAPEIPLLDKMAREAQERLVLEQVVAEMQANLRDIEQVLDAYFRDPAERRELQGITPKVHQLTGALSMLGENAARDALAGIEAALERFAQATDVPAQAEFEAVAQVLSALGFHVAALARGETSDFAAVLQPRRSALPQAATETVTVAQPTAANTIELAEANPVEAPAIAAALPERAAPVSEGATPAAPTDGAAPATGATAVATAVSGAGTTGGQNAAPDTSVDGELLAVFLEEAQEVLQAMAQQQLRLMAVPSDQDALVAIRRGFHTLKGSGRMVGLTLLGEGAWTVEQALNWWLREDRPASPQVFELIAGAHAWFTQTVADLATGVQAGEAAFLQELAQAVKTGQPANLAAAPPIGPVTPDSAAPPSAAETAPPALTLTLVPSAPAPTDSDPATEAGEASPPTPAVDAAPVLALTPPVAASAEPEAIPSTEPQAIPPAEPEVISFTQLQAVSSTEPEAVPSMAPEAAPEPALTDFAAMAQSLADSAAAMPQVENPLPVSVPEASGEPAATDEVSVGEARVSTTVFTIFSGESHALIGTLKAELETLRIHGIITDDMIRAAHTLGGIAGTVQLAGLSALGYAFEKAITRLAQDALSESEQALVTEAVETLGGMVEVAVALRVPDAPHALVARLEEAAAPRLADLPDLPMLQADQNVLLPEEEGALDREADGEVPPAEPEPPATAWSAAPVPPPAFTAPPALVPVPSNAARPLQRREQRLQDELDPQLLPLFLEEAAELVPAVGQDLRNWRDAAADAALGRAAAQALQRHLHTLKGSARMAGAMAVGDLAHHMETRVEGVLAGTATLAMDELDGSHDRLCELVERLQHPLPAAAVDEAPADAGSGADVPAGAEPTEALPSGPPLLRVRADAVDRMVDQTGEISIARSRIEAELRGLKGAMHELTDNVLRLRAQLREIEIQAESQIQAASAAQSAPGAEGFDPLEFDRFTRFQELTRIMAESVNDVQTVHQNLLRSVEATDAALAAQARLNRDLQQDLMRVRMVAFGTLAERLYRVVRQSAKEAGKRANLDIRGGNVELDRAVLERMTAPIEHVLRNAVIHGLEAPAARAAAGKAEIGDIRIEVSQEAGEMRLAIRDDGAGLDLERIRARALQGGLLGAGAQLSEEELAQFIFHPGFSTASELTLSAGRGVGMDVVRTEVAGLGGRVELTNQPGQGLAIAIFLPLTLAVTQVVMVRAGERMHALPAVIVEQVMQYRPDQLAALAAEGQVDWHGRRYPLHYLAHLLGSSAAVPEHKRLTPVVLLRSGASALALHVDEIIGGNQEVVVKAIGPQLQSVPGVAGATLLGTGEIVLILNPVPLAELRALREAAAPAAALAAVEEQPLAPLIMVVDDSLTVRKITSRLIEREGWTVVTARDGVEALERLKEGLPDVMLLDIEMPRMDGFELARHLRGDPALAALPVIMISSRTADKHRNVARDLGIQAFLGKPWQEDELLRHIRACLPAR